MCTSRFSSCCPCTAAAARQARSNVQCMISSSYITYSENLTKYILGPLHVGLRARTFAGAGGRIARERRGRSPAHDVFSDGKKRAVDDRRRRQSELSTSPTNDNQINELRCAWC